MEGGKVETIDKVDANEGVEDNPSVVPKPIGDMSHAQNLNTKDNLREIWAGIKCLLKRSKEQGQQGDK